jgi:16S rRNA (guanine(527)-N(7))-methyltransferase RsmG
MSYSALLDAEFQTLGLSLPSGQQEKLACYCVELEHWNQRMNLTSLQGAELVRRLIAEPAWIGAHIGMAGSFADIGSGNGSPAIPLAVTTGAQGHLVESRLKRVVFLRHLKAKLALPNISVHHDRFEDIVEKLDPVRWITLQAVSLTPALLKDLRGHLLPTTTVVWITARGAAPIAGSTMVRVPGRETEAWIFSLDHS